MAKKAALIILDGFGIAPPAPGNAITQANTPNLDKLFAEYPTSQLEASGLAVGLPEGQMGNSEVGHTNIGAGRVVFQILPKITQEIRNGKFFENPVYAAAMDAAAKGGKALHIMGLLSDGGVHSHITHILAAMDMAKQRKVAKVYIHCFLDGRDVSPKSGAGFVKRIQDKCRELGNAEIATISGRYYAMDRDKNWDRIQLAYDAMTAGKAPFFDDPVEAVEASYRENVTDEFFKPVVCCRNAEIHTGDSVIFMNFRPDRARQMTWALNLENFDGFERKEKVFPLNYVCTAQYDESLPLPIAYPPETIENTLGDYLSSLNKTQLRVAETEKYAHVTFFFNGGVEKTIAGEDRFLVPSPKEFPTYDLIPEMSAEKVCDKVIESLAAEKYDVIICNFANCDMVGHTGVMAAAIKAVETCDTCMGRIVDEISKHPDYVLIVTADHGNADVMFDENGKVNTAHTTNPVPFCVTDKNVHLENGKLADIAPTMLSLMSIPVPKEMTGKNLITHI